MTSRSTPRRPCEPMTMRSTDSAMAASMIASPGSPCQMRQRMGTPLALAASDDALRGSLARGPDLVDALAEATARSPAVPCGR